MCWIQIYSTLLSSNAFLETFAGFSNRIQRRLCIRRFFKGVLNTKEVSHNHSGLEILWKSNHLSVVKFQHSISLHENPNVIFEWLLTSNTIKNYSNHCGLSGMSMHELEAIGHKKENPFSLPTSLESKSRNSRGSKEYEDDHWFMQQSL